MKCASEMGKQNTHAQVHTYNNLYDCEQVSVVGGGGGRDQKKILGEYFPICQFIGTFLP